MGWTPLELCAEVRFATDLSWPGTNWNSLGSTQPTRWGQLAQWQGIELAHLGNGGMPSGSSYGGCLLSPNAACDQWVRYGRGR